MTGENILGVVNQIILLKCHVVKLPSEYVCSYSWSLADSSFGWRSLFWLWAAVNDVEVLRASKGECSVLNGSSLWSSTLLLPPPYQGLGNIKATGRRKLSFQSRWSLMNCHELVSGPTHMHIWVGPRFRGLLKRTWIWEGDMLSRDVGVDVGQKCRHDHNSSYT